MSSLYIIHIINISEIFNAIYNTMEFNNKLCTVLGPQS